MFIIIRFLLYTLPFIIYGLFDFIRFYPQNLKWAVLALSLYLLFVIWYLLRNTVKKKSRYMALADLSHYIITPLLLFLSSVFFLIFINNLLIYRILSALTAFFIYLFYENLFIYLYYPHKYILSSLENLSAYLNFATAFFFYSGYYGLSVFLRIENKWLLLALFTLNAILFLQTFLINKLKAKVYIWGFLIANVLLIELLWVFKYLTWAYLVKGFVLASLYYLLSAFLRFYYLQALNKKLVWKHIAIFLLVNTIVLITAKWF